MIPRARVSIFLSSNSHRCFFHPRLVRQLSTLPRPPSDKDESPESIQFPKYNTKTYGAEVKKFSQLPVNFGANQHISIDDQLKEKLRSVLWKFNAPIRYAFAYGSGVFQQAGADSKDVLPPAPVCVGSPDRKDADGGFHFWGFAYATLARVEFGAESTSLFGDEISWKWSYKLGAR
jgi:Phosphatidate cytidylyltransferase, mitochondrial